MSNIKIFQLQKRESHEFSKIQDKYALDEKSGCFALADGTTQSFNSEKWAGIITKKFVEKPTFNPSQLIDFFTKSVQEFKAIKVEFDSNSGIASLQKAKSKQGGTSTFIGLKFIGSDKAQLISCGDSNLFQIRKNNPVESFPFSEVDLLDKNRHFLNTENLIENNVDETYFKTETITYAKNDLLILATDALSRLFLQEHTIISEFLLIDDFEGLHTFCLKYWEKKELEEDDISAIVISPDKSNNINIIKPPKNFSFPKKEQKEFVPTSLLHKNEPNSTKNIDMQEIRTNFHQLGQDFKRLKDQLSFQRLLIFIILGLLVINIFFVFLTRPNKNEDLQKELSEKTAEIENLNTQLNSLKEELPSQVEKVEKTKYLERNPNLTKENNLENTNQSDSVQNMKEEKNLSISEGSNEKPILINDKAVPTKTSSQ